MLYKKWKALEYFRDEDTFFKDITSSSYLGVELWYRSRKELKRVQIIGEIALLRSILCKIYLKHVFLSPLFPQWIQIIYKM